MSVLGMAAWKSREESMLLVAQVSEVLQLGLLDGVSLRYEELDSFGQPMVRLGLDGTEVLLVTGFVPDFARATVTITARRVGGGAE